MEHNNQEITIAQLCEMIDLLCPCVDDFPYVYDFNNDFYYIAPSAAKRFAIPENGFHNVVEQLHKLVHPADWDALMKDLTEVVAGKKDFHNLQYRWLNLEGDLVWINCRGRVVKNSDNTRYMFGCINEIGTRQKADNISGLLGESSLKNYLQEVSSSLPSGYLLRLGIDDFKGINEKLGIEYGDMILRRTAECISECILPEQKLYRFVADEFIILDFSGNSPKHALSLYKQIRQAIDHFVENNHYEAVFTISGGVLEYNKAETFSFSDLMKLSEFALNEAKRRGKNQCYTFQQEDYDDFLKKRRLKQILSRAVRNDFEGFEAYFQPLFYSDSRTLYGAETLMRFHTEEDGMISPAEFIPILEETGLIIPLGRWILHQALVACKKIMQWVPDFRISVNVSYVQIMKSNIIDEIVDAAKEHGIPASNVVIELTESGILESNSYFSKLWSKLKATGISLALDDFGTGYSNFHYLYNLKPDIIKIDRTFTAKALQNEYEYNLLSLMSNLVHNLNLQMCIEGIETEDEETRMLTISPDYSQGFYYGRPCPYDQFVEQFITP